MHGGLIKNKVGRSGRLREWVMVHVRPVIWNTKQLHCFIFLKKKKEMEGVWGEDEDKIGFSIFYEWENS